MESLTEAAAMAASLTSTRLDVDQVQHEQPRRDDEVQEDAIMSSVHQQATPMTHEAPELNEETMLDVGPDCCRQYEQM